MQRDERSISDLNGEQVDQVNRQDDRRTILCLLSKLLSGLCLEEEEEEEVYVYRNFLSPLPYHTIFIFYVYILIYRIALGVSIVVKSHHTISYVPSLMST